MITLTRLNGQRFTINSDVVARIEVTPDTVIHLADGTRYVVEEPVDEIVAAIVGFRAQVLARAHVLVSEQTPSPGLRVITGGPADDETEV